MRDFRDAKVMARALRDALKAKSVETSHSESLELIARAFGFDNWNVLVAKIETAQSPAVEAQVVSGAADEQATTLHCSFCGRSQHDVSKLIAGPKVFICDRCVGLCDDIMEGETVLDLFAGRDVPEGYAEDLASNVERAKKHSAHWRSTLEQIQRLSAAKDASTGAPVSPIPPGFEHLAKKAKVDLVAMQERLERALGRYEEAQRSATSSIHE